MPPYGVLGSADESMDLRSPNLGSSGLMGRTWSAWVMARRLVIKAYRSHSMAAATQIEAATPNVKAPGEAIIDRFMDSYNISIGMYYLKELMV
jgi:hypothetical protein